MNRKWIVVVAVLAAGCSQTLQSALKGVVGGIDRPTVAAVRPRITDLDLSQVTLAFDVDVKNPYPFALISPKFRYGLDIQGSEFVQSSEAAGATIPAKGAGTVTLPVKLSYAKLWESFNKLADAQEVDYTLRGALLLSAGNQDIELPLEKSGTLPILRAPKFSNLKLDFPSVSMSRAGVTLDADMLNPNAFPLGISDMGYALRLGEIDVGKLVASTQDSVGAGKSGHVKLKGEISGSQSLMRLISGQSLGLPHLRPTGKVQTPYGPASLE